MQRTNSNKLVLFKVVFYFLLYCRRTVEQSELEYHVLTTLENCYNSDAFVIKRFVQHSSEEWHQYCFDSPAGSESYSVCV